MPLYYSATKKQTPDMTIEDLVNYLKAYVCLQFPESSIDFRIDTDKKNIKLAAGGNLDDSFDHAACYVRPGSNEGDIIEILIMKRDQNYQDIGWIKSFCDTEENWAIAAAVSEVITDLYQYHTLPLIVDFAVALPGKTKEMEGKVIYFYADETSFDVVIDDVTIAAYDFSDLDEQSAERTTGNYLKDWEDLAVTLKMHGCVLSKPELEDESNTMGI